MIVICEHCRIGQEYEMLFSLYKKRIAELETENAALAAENKKLKRGKQNAKNSKNN